MEEVLLSLGFYKYKNKLTGRNKPMWIGKLKFNLQIIFMDVPNSFTSVLQY